jgi:putative FmdB family regulatory protein
MPIYEYRCSACGFENEFLQKMSDAPLTECPECKQPTLVKKVTAAGFQLKGSGWYVTDFRGGGKTSAPATEPKSGESKGAEPAAGEAKSDAKSGSAGGSSEAAAKPAGTSSPASGTS